MAKKRRKKATKRKATKRKVAKRKATKRKATKRKATRKKATKRKATKRKATKRKATRKKATKKKKTKRKPNKAFMRPLTPSKELAVVVGKAALPRTQAVKKIWAYIKRNKLQDNRNRRNIKVDSKLKPVFKKNVVTMFEIAKVLSKHLK